MTCVVTRNVAERFRGLLASSMLEIAPGIYVSPRMSVRVREQLWQILGDWSELLASDSGLLMIWPEREHASGLGMKILGWPKAEVMDYEGVFLVRREPTKEQERALELLEAGPEEAIQLTLFGPDESNWPSG